MRFPKAFLAIALAAPLLSGCGDIGAAVGVATGSVATVAPATTADAEKALTVAHLALNAVAENILSAAHSGLLHGKDATTVKTYFDQAADSLAAADQADKLANAEGVMSKVNEAESLIAQIQTIVKG